MSWSYDWTAANIQIVRNKSQVELHWIKCIFSFFPADYDGQRTMLWPFQKKANSSRVTAGQYFMNCIFKVTTQALSKNRRNARMGDSSVNRFAFKTSGVELGWQSPEGWDNVFNPWLMIEWIRVEYSVPLTDWKHRFRLHRFSSRKFRGCSSFRDPWFEW